MRLSELAIIYLATAAPFGVAFFIRRQERGGGRALALARAAGLALVWPVAAARLLSGRGGTAEESELRDGRRVERARRETVNSLRDAEEAMRRAGLLGDEASRHALFAARECVERYAGLALACADARPSAAPTEREMELCRLAGRAGEDLLVAGRCFHRRNVTRLVAHRERARAELSKALAAVRGLADGLADATRRDEEAARAVSRALLQTFARAVELLSLLEDREAALGAARLLDAECARLRRLEAGARAHAPEGGEPCTTPAAHRAFATRTLPTTTSTRA
ncbi:MAG TPA: hypothetical protein VG148_04595 [Pyrinomonadaceae bacterium]|nr:hypothetical protein [Pyrinomonadaceae bacterium]